MPLLPMQIINHHLIFSDANDFVDSLPRIPSRKQAKSDEDNHGRFWIDAMFPTGFQERYRSQFPNGSFIWKIKTIDGSFDWPVHKAAYWGDRSDFLQEKPKDDVNPTTILQFLMLYPNYRNNKERVNYRGNTPLHLASARGNLEAVRILMESKATTNKEPINNRYVFHIIGKTRL